MPTLNGVPLSCEEILDRYGALVYRLAVQGTGSPVDGEDVAQEVFVSLIQSDPRFTDELHLRAWLVRATANRCRSWGTSAWRRHTVPLAQGGTPPPPRQRAWACWRRWPPCPPSTAGRYTSTISRGTPPRRSAPSSAVPGTQCSPGSSGPGRS